MSDADGKAYDPIAMLLIQLQYDRADVALVSSQAALLMDAVIQKIEEAASVTDHEANEFDNVSEI